MTLDFQLLFTNPYGELTWPAVGHDDRLSICLFREKTHEMDLVFLALMLNLGVIVGEGVDSLLK
jgi:hypothetical protein